MIGVPCLDMESRVTFHDPERGFVIGGHDAEEIVHEIAHIVTYPEYLWRVLDPNHLEFNGAGSDIWADLLRIEAPVLSCTYDILSRHSSNAMIIVEKHAGMLVREYSRSVYGDCTQRMIEGSVLVTELLTRCDACEPIPVEEMRNRLLAMDVYLMSDRPDDIHLRHTRVDYPPYWTAYE
jgi:hypothetical protein